MTGQVINTELVKTKTRGRDGSATISPKNAKNGTAGDQLSSTNSDKANRNTVYNPLWPNYLSDVFKFCNSHSPNYD